MKLILISGKARSGKDTFAKYLSNELTLRNYKVCNLGYGDYIRYYVKKYFGWNGNDEDKPRDLMNYIGTDIIRKQIDKNFHVNRVMQDVKVLSFFFDVAIISDVREPIEIEVPKKTLEDCISIKIVRSNFEDGLSLEQRKAYTETALDNFDNYDFIIENIGTLEDFKNKAIDFIDKEVIR